MPTITTFLNIILEVQASAVRQEGVEKEETKVSQYLLRDLFVHLKFFEKEIYQ